MSKKAGSFFKSVISKGKKLFKKEERQEPSCEDDFGTEEDTDFIEVGRQGAKMPRILADIQDFAGQKLQAADELLHGAHLKAGQSDLSQIIRNLGEKALVTEEDDEEEAKGAQSAELCYLVDYDAVDLERIQAAPRAIAFVLLVGFHHKVGSQVEFVYPPVSEDVAEDLSVDFLKHVPRLALPDGSHIAEVSTYFSVCRAAT